MGETCSCGCSDYLVNEVVEFNQETGKYSLFFRSKTGKFNYHIGTYSNMDQAKDAADRAFNMGYDRFVSEWEVENM